MSDVSSCCILQYCSDQFDRSYRAATNKEGDKKYQAVAPAYGRHQSVSCLAHLGHALIVGYGRYWKGAQGVIFVYNVSNKRTFEGIEKWMEALPDRTPKPQALPMLQAAGQAF